MTEEKPTVPRPPLSPSADGRARLEVAGDGTLKLTKPDGTLVEKVRLALAWPLRYRDRYIILLDDKGKETFMATELSDFAPDCQEFVRQELKRRYLETRILAVNKLRVERQVSYWEAQTDRGLREFVVRGSETNPYRFTEHHWQIIDAVGNRYEIPDLTALDPTSQALLEQLED